MGNGRAIVLDLDGTLVDTVPDISRVLSLVLLDAGLPAADEEETTRWIGGGVRKLIVRAFTNRGDPDAERLADLRTEAFVSLAKEAPAPKSRIYEGVDETLSRLRRDGWSLVVCTNKAEPLARAVLDAVGLSAAVDALVGGSHLPKKPAPDMVEEALRRVRSASSGSVYVGDSVVDLQAAHASGLPCIIVRYGYHQGMLSKMSADAMVDQFSEIPRALSRFSTGARTGRVR